VKKGLWNEEKEGKGGRIRLSRSLLATEKTELTCQQRLNELPRAKGKKRVNRSASLNGWGKPLFVHTFAAAPDWDNGGGNPKGPGDVSLAPDGGGRWNSKLSEERVIYTQGERRGNQDKCIPKVLTRRKGEKREEQNENKTKEGGQNNTLLKSPGRLGGKKRGLPNRIISLNPNDSRRRRRGGRH